MNDPPNSTRKVLTAELTDLEACSPPNSYLPFQDGLFASDRPTDETLTIRSQKICAS